MKKLINFTVFIFILMLFVLPSVFPNPMKNNKDVLLDNVLKENTEYIDIERQSDFGLKQDVDETKSKEDVDKEKTINTNYSLNEHELDDIAKKNYDEEVKKFKEGKLKNNSPILNSISNFSYNLQYVVSIIVSFSILGYMIFKCRKTKNN